MLLQWTWGETTLVLSARSLFWMDLPLCLLLALTYWSLLLRHIAKPLLWHPWQSARFYHWLLPVWLITRYHLLKGFHLSGTLNSWVLLSYMWLECWCGRVNSCPNLSFLWPLSTAVILTPGNPLTSWRHIKWSSKHKSEGSYILSFNTNNLLDFQLVQLF